MIRVGAVDRLTLVLAEELFVTVDGRRLARDLPLAVDITGGDRRFRLSLRLWWASPEGSCVWDLWHEADDTTPEVHLAFARPSSRDPTSNGDRRFQAWVKIPIPASYLTVAPTIIDPEDPALTECPRMNTHSGHLFAVRASRPEELQPMPLDLALRVRRRCVPLVPPYSSLPSTPIDVTLDRAILPLENPSILPPISYVVVRPKMIGNREHRRIRKFRSVYTIQAAEPCPSYVNRLLSLLKQTYMEQFGGPPPKKVKYY